MDPIPYCGTAPVPGSVAWNLDPLLLATLAGGLALSLWLTRGQGSAPRLAAMTAGWVVLAAALVSPLCNLSVALFAARETQHMVIMLVAAPLIATAFAGRAAAGASAGGLAAATLGFAVALWAWHVPALYALTFGSTAVYWTMHATMAGAAVWFWSALLARGTHPLAAALAALVTAIQMSGLSAGLTFATAPLYTAHLATTAAWGHTALEDQQLAGVLMWTVGGLLFTAATILSMARLLAPQEADLTVPAAMPARR